ncbi:MAG: CPBP family intramembrane glutamic endopeptidase [Bacteroidota bacterium]|jgi:hypothetical protein
MNTDLDQINSSKKDGRRNFIYTSVLGFVGVLFFLPFALKIIPAKVLLKHSINTIIVVSIVQSLIFILILAAIGATLAQRIGFRTIYDEITSTRKDLWIILKRQLIYGVPIGMIGALVAYLTAPDFIAYLKSFPHLTRLFGGLYEEIIMRWGIMTLIVWIIWRTIQKGKGSPKKLLVWSGIILSQILFASGHIFNLIKFGIANPLWSVVTIFIVSFPWGWLYWKQGIESAIIAHVSFHAFVILLVVINL